MRDVALLVVDMQEGFLMPSSPLYVVGGPAIVPAVERAIHAAHSAEIPVVHVIRVHRSSGVDIDLSRQGLFAAHGGLLVEDTPDVREIVELRPSSDDLVVTKTRWSAFFATGLDLLLRRLHIHGIVLAGVQTPNCIRATAVDGLSLDYETFVLADATASQTTLIQESNLADLAAMGARIVSVDQLHELLSA